MRSRHRSCFNGQENKNTAQRHVAPKKRWINITIRCNTVSKIRELFEEGNKRTVETFLSLLSQVQCNGIGCDEMPVDSR